MLQACRGAAGFTLIELIVVLVIIAIVAAIAAPSLSGFGRGRRLDNAASELLSVAKWGHERARMDGRVYRLNFDVNQRTYWLTYQLDDGTFDYVPQEFGRTFTLPDSVTINTNLVQQPDGMYVQFQPNGRSDQMAIIQLTDSTDGRETDVGCLSMTEPFHILSDEERQNEANAMAAVPQ